MSTAAEWARGYGRQAEADFATWFTLQRDDDVPECHRLLFLQMTCEKLCKAHLVATGTPISSLQASHAYIAGPLPVLIRQQILLLRQGQGRLARNLLRGVSHLAREIELLNPAVIRDGQRPDNCEYPWEDGQEVVHPPLDWTFPPTALLTVATGRTFLKLLHQAIATLLRDL